ncbi:MAG: hypothetical protein ACREQZ_01895, partial [Woeseiaceae bacterium]
MAQFVSGIDAETTRQSRDDRQTDECPNAQVLRPRPPRRSDEAEEVQRYDGVGQQSVVAIVIELRQDLVRITRIAAANVSVCRDFIQRQK